jgi:hypothetical protein
MVKWQCAGCALCCIATLAADGLGGALAADPLLVLLVLLLLLVVVLLLLQVCVPSVPVPALGPGQREADVAAHEDRQVRLRYLCVTSIHVCCCYTCECLHMPISAAVLLHYEGAAIAQAHKATAAAS